MGTNHRTQAGLQQPPAKAQAQTTLTLGGVVRETLFETILTADWHT